MDPSKRQFILDMFEIEETSPFPTSEAEVGLGRNILYRVNIEVTLNHPPDAKYKKILAKGEEELRGYYLKLFEVMLINSKMRDLVDRERTVTFFEHGGIGGKLHLHARIVFLCSRVYIIEGIIQSLVKGWKACLTKKYVYKDKEYYPRFYRYLSPDCVIQWIDPEDTERLIHWDSYIRKNAH